eukprot:CAMPEP_0176347062 /NCGR_PEP_ID=MMETSP0126-20121128/6738_1 /TAXON_ID=141414 ORGANISM="Strombidinopsis acuminatum, Strain SPMC142" /NCGR_SAMPLE_ID=MMETSP0126 /ASSEMBLY_ACC=CAM_ASM_000229 /LENGTH=71 /DNA_ID=CAMNT_0017694975 /DNA_START=195 /DNA_END=410 /DNA_ORIENTATION=-
MAGDKSTNEAMTTKNLLQAIERKVEEEVSVRHKDQTDMKSYMESKFVSMVEKLKTDEKSNLERERRLMEQV